MKLNEFDEISSSNCWKTLDLLFFSLFVIYDTLEFWRSFNFTSKFSTSYLLNFDQTDIDTMVTVLRECLDLSIQLCISWLVKIAWIKSIRASFFILFPRARSNLKAFLQAFPLEIYIKYIERDFEQVWLIRTRTRKLKSSEHSETTKMIFGSKWIGKNESLCRFDVKYYSPLRPTQSITSERGSTSATFAVFHRIDRQTDRLSSPNVLHNASIHHFLLLLSSSFRLFPRIKTIFQNFWSPWK